ncbi:putative acyl-CoA dehydrogenase FadE [Paenibacillus larvae subsp. larvae]|uniref:Putative acyl-CoA dehydrogenase FadE n=1 Tax=Paenibacillus larvae subsp. larvae TaxID=147375 RepID=A0A2L1UD69_9BACL|nr:acyl-CoA dehydrogenase family protein [Paenibacillus larvae]AQZ48146.1 acyl-CoA dehydrogenase [Paenibacillus larvae subsp. pulvifaciens]AVF26102.1 putative acyl-CoA dehydrogenase FadE [Paenibacillus larvae subsp. larvae]AVF30880.1 putative acyl-CoA dehydrogenase FadE [Paenibacillus larvae subsp. larvae]MBH0340935.1 acyl-CoA dehydrogenase [Paenibacillus larvae]MCY7521777.1 acyl-CoA dehydrogenase family protein [Paenibacillus larvae]
MIETKIAGGSFVLDDIDSELVVTPEDFNEEQRMILQTTVDFLEGEVLPKDEEIEKLDYELTLDLLKKAGELGLLSADVPEEYDGLGLDKVSSTIISETLARAASFGLSVGAHVGIGTLPIVFFGTPEQKKKYLPQLATGEKIAAYCLTEPASGSDALGAKTTAKLSEDGQHYILNGSKIFITNAGFADIFIVYAKVDGKDFSAFIVEKEMPGFSLGPEEKKMGIKGSSTRPLYFEDCKVPVENLLGEVGRGHIIAFNILNIGRFKLGAGCLGGAKEAIEHSVKYANTRKQFGTEISSFPLIGKKLADMNIRTFVAESMVYRTSGLIDHILKDLDHSSPDAGKQSAKGIAEYALECSINKVFASEVLDFLADEAVQIHGGYGFTQEYKVERIYRDSRINRIFEGTNEINRMLIPGTLLKKAMKGELPLLQKVQSLQSELMSMTPGSQSFEGTLEQESHLLAQAKKLFLMVGGMAVQKLQANIEKEQEMLSNLADLMIEIYAMESVLLRTKKLIARQGEDKVKNAIQMTEVYLHEAFAKIEAIAKQCLVMVEEGDMLRTGLSMVKRLTRTSPINTISLKREIAQRVIQAEKYVV